MLRIGMLLIAGAMFTLGMGLATLSAAASGADSSLGGLVSCAPTIPPEEETEGEQTDQKSESSS